MQPPSVASSHRRRSTKTISMLVTATRLKLFRTSIAAMMKVAKRHCPAALYHQRAPTQVTDGRCRRYTMHDAPTATTNDRTMAAVTMTATAAHRKSTQVN